MCRWPIGDPKADDFYFCGHVPKAASHYCEVHNQRAHQPARAKYNRKANRVAVAGD